MPSNGFGASFGNNFGGGGIIYVTDLNPAPNALIAPGSPIEFSLGVAGDLISLDSIKITIAGEEAYDGSTDSFSSNFSAGSSYSYNGTINGYDFVIVRDPFYDIDDVLIFVTASSSGGSDTTQTWSLQNNQADVYPETPLNSILTIIPLSRFSGESQEGLLEGAAGQVFFSSGLVEADQNVQIDVDSVEVKTENVERYRHPVENNNHPFVLGPPLPVAPGGSPDFPNYPTVANHPVLNDARYGLVKLTNFTVHGVLTDTLTSEVVDILY